MWPLFESCRVAFPELGLRGDYWLCTSTWAEQGSPKLYHVLQTQGYLSEFLIPLWLMALQILKETKGSMGNIYRLPSPPGSPSRRATTGSSNGGALRSRILSALESELESLRLDSIAKEPTKVTNPPTAKATAHYKGPTKYKLKPLQSSSSSSNLPSVTLKMTENYETKTRTEYTRFSWRANLLPLSPRNQSQNVPKAVKQRGQLLVPLD